MKYEIKANKRRSFLMFCLSMLFVVLGVLPFLGVGLREYRKYVPVFHDVIFIVVIIFFGFTALIYLKMILSTKPVISISEKGICDNVFFGLIEWENVAGFRKVRVQKQDYILILLETPEKYIEKFNFFKQKWLNFNLKQYGTPVIIHTGNLKIDQEELLNIVRKEWTEYKRNKRE
jgi:hypothetical protein